MLKNFQNFKNFNKNNSPIYPNRIEKQYFTQKVLDELNPKLRNTSPMVQKPGGEDDENVEI